VSCFSLPACLPSSLCDLWQTAISKWIGLLQVAMLMGALASMTLLHLVEFGELWSINPKVYEKVHRMYTAGINH